MEQLWVRDCDHVSRHTAGCFTTRVPNEEVLAAAATLDGAKRLWLCNDIPAFHHEGRPEECYITGGAHGLDCGWRLVIPLPDKETTDE